jgi:hypothetical protein
MNRTIIDDQGRRNLWILWGKLRDVANGKPFTWAFYTHGEGYCYAAKEITRMLDSGEVYTDQEWRWNPTKTEKQIEADDTAAAKVDRSFREKLPHYLVIDEGAVAYLRELAKRLFEERTLTKEEGDRCSTWIDKICHGGPVLVVDEQNKIGRIIFESFIVRQDEFELVKREAGERIIFRHREPGGVILDAAIKRGEKCEIDYEEYRYSLGQLPPICYRRLAEMVDGTTREINFGAGEGNDVPVIGYWSETGEPEPYSGDGSDLPDRTVVLDNGLRYDVEEYCPARTLPDTMPAMIVAFQHEGKQTRGTFEVSQVKAVVPKERYFVQMTKLRGSTGRGVGA